MLVSTEWSYNFIGSVNRILRSVRLLNQTFVWWCLPFYTSAYFTRRFYAPPYYIQGRPGFLGIQYIGVFNFRYTLFLCLKLGIKYSLTTNFGYIKYIVVFLILVFYTIFSIIFGILEGLFRVFWYSTTHLGRPCIFAFTQGPRSLDAVRIVH